MDMTAYHHGWTRPAAAICILCAIAILSGCAGTSTKEAAPEPVPEPVPAAPPAAAVIAEAQQHASNENYEAAVSLLEELVAAEAHNVEALRLLASIYAATGKREESARLWKEVALLDPMDPEAAYEVGVSLARDGDWQGVRSRMLAAESNGAADSRHFLLIGEADLELGYKGEAEKYLLKARDQERALVLLGQLYYEDGRLEEAERTFESILEKNPDNYTAHIHLGWLHASRSENRRAAEHYRRAVALNPGDPLAALSLAALLERMERSEEAISYYRQGLALPGVPAEEKRKAYNSLSRLLVTDGRTTEAIKVIRAGLGEFPGAGGLYYQWGEALLREGNKAEAKNKFKRAADDPVWRDVALRKIYAIEN
jgi:Flp pilus assembly protein TadD